MDINQQLFRYETKEQLLAVLHQPGDHLVCCHQTQNVSLAHQLVLDACNDHAKVILFGLDAIGFDQFNRLSQQARIHPNWCYPVTSVAPSTSATSWTSILTGMIPADHGLHGVVFYEPQLGHSVHTLRASAFTINQGMIDTDSAPQFVDKQQLIFHHVSQLHRHKCWSIGRLGFDEKAPLHTQLTAGSRNIVIADYENHLMEPEFIVNNSLKALRDIIDRPQSCFVFCHLNFDTFIHENSYQHQQISDAFALLKIFLDDYRAQDVACLFVSDHGMIGQQRIFDDCPIFAPQIVQNSYAYPGGAGRIQYFYPKKQHLQSTEDYLNNYYQDTAEVLSRKAYIEKYLRASQALVKYPQRIGDIVSVARTATYPSVMLEANYEHGGFSRDEMLAVIGAF